MSRNVSKPVISIPTVVHRRAVKRSEKIRAKELEEAHSRYYKGDRNIPPVISCRRPELNHYKGQQYAPFKRLPLASEHWMSRSTIGDFFSFNPFRAASATSWYKYVPRAFDRLQFSEEDSVKIRLKGADKPSFDDFELDPRIVRALNCVGMRIPTNIQHDALPVLLQGKSGLVASETGNGKTLTFLLPIIQNVLKKMEPEETHGRKFNSPLAVIITPGRELAAQIKEVVGTICADFDIKIRLATGSNTEKKIEFGRRERTDILVGSVGGLAKMFAGKLFFPDFVDTIVLDEVDTLTDDTFRGVTNNLLATLRKKYDQQIILCGATFPSTLDNALGQVIDTEGLEVIQTQHLHRVLPHIYQKFIRAPKVNKHDYLLEVLQPDLDKKKKVLIFSNKSSTSAFIGHFLNSNGVDNVHFSGGNMHPSLRRSNLGMFLNNEVNVMTCTDIVSRGIDTQNVDHVINYDFPWNMTDYLHRVGRVGRAGSSAKSSSKVTNLVTGKISVALVQELEKSVRLNKPIPEVESNVVSLLDTYYQKPDDDDTEPDS